MRRYVFKYHVMQEESPPDFQIEADTHQIEKGALVLFDHEKGYSGEIKSQRTKAIIPFHTFDYCEVRGAI